MPHAVEIEREAEAVQGRGWRQKDEPLHTLGPESSEDCGEISAIGQTCDDWFLELQAVQNLSQPPCGVLFGERRPRWDAPAHVADRVNGVDSEVRGQQGRHVLPGTRIGGEPVEQDERSSVGTAECYDMRGSCVCRQVQLLDRYTPGCELSSIRLKELQLSLARLE